MVLPLWRRTAFAVLAFALLVACAQSAATPDTARFILKLRDAGGTDAVATLAARTRTRLTYIRALSGGTHLVALPSAQASADLVRLRADGAVEFIEPERRYQHQ